MMRFLFLILPWYLCAATDVTVESYLKSLEAIPKNSAYQMGKDEEMLYNEALGIYLDPQAKDAASVSLKIRDLYAGTVRIHPDYASLGFLTALAYAELNDYSNFFSQFYRSYKLAPHHFLAYKTLGILHGKLFERARTAQEKERERKEAFESFKKAKELYPKDPSLYKMEISYSLDRKSALESNLKEMLAKDIVIPRSDLSFYIDQLLAYGQNNLADVFVAKAKKWYPYSHTLGAAEEILEEKQGKRNDGTTSFR